MHGGKPVTSKGQTARHGAREREPPPQAGGAVPRARRCAWRAGCPHTAQEVRSSRPAAPEVCPPASAPPEGVSGGSEANSSPNGGQAAAGRQRHPQARARGHVNPTGRCHVCVEGSPHWCGWASVRVKNCTPEFNGHHAQQSISIVGALSHGWDACCGCAGQNRGSALTAPHPRSRTGASLRHGAPSRQRNNRPARAHRPAARAPNHWPQTHPQG